MVSVKGQVANIEKALNITMLFHLPPSERRALPSTPQGPRAPSPNLSVALGILPGSTTLSIPRPASLKHDTNAIRNATGFGDSATSSAATSRHYYGGTTLTGAGQIVGLLEFYG